MCIRDRIIRYTRHFSAAELDAFLNDLLRQYLPWARRQLDWVEAVSYTHLDVYKRQVQGCLIGILQAGTHGQAIGQTGGLDAQGLDELRCV